MAYMNYWDHIFHNAATVAANGNAFEVKGRNSLTVEIYGTAENTARVITFYAKSFSGVLRAISGVKRAGLTTALSTNGTGELWQFDDIAGFDFIVMDLTSTTDGTVTVKGRAVA